MPSPSAARHRGSIIRQLSLQGQTNPQTPAGRRGLKKQLSEDGGRRKMLESVEITGQGWSSGVDKSEAGLRNVAQDASKLGNAKGATPSRPKPVKLAWTDRKQEGLENPTGVEIVARKCQGQPRPLTSKVQRIANLPLLGDKDTLVYTKQQLAERLRVAWREREKNKPNLNIFLTHTAEETAPSGNEDPDTGRSGAAPPSDLLIHGSVTFRSISTSESSLSSAARRVCVAEPLRILRREATDTEAQDGASSGKPSVAKIAGDPEPRSILKNVPGIAGAPDSAGRSVEREINLEKVSHLAGSATDCPDFKTFPVDEPSKKFGSNLTNRRFVDMRSKAAAVSEATVTPSEGKENIEVPLESDSDHNRHRGREDIDEECGWKSRSGNEMRAHGTAQERRASFRSGSLLHKTIDEGYPPRVPPRSSEEADEDEAQGENANGIKVFLKKAEQQRPPLTRTFSAPTQNDSPPSKQQTNSKLAVAPKMIAHYASSVDLGGTDEDLVASRGSRIKSAPIRRKLKTAASRRRHRDKESDSSGDEKQPRDSSKKKPSRRKVTSRTNANEIVTMVSLVSPATSDTEDCVIPMPAESWAENEKDDKPTASTEDAKQKPSEETTKEVSSFVIQKFVSLRKTTKTVSFVQHPPMNRSYSVSFPSRRAPAGTPIIVPTPVITNPALTPAQLKEREKRPQPPSPGVLSGTDNRTVKRRLIRTASAPQVKESAVTPEVAVKSKAGEACGELEKGDSDKAEGCNGEGGRNEPEFKSPKERECWMLYRKMTEKGVAVSFDTVLRGMLTPTEYRLRRNQLLSTC